MTVLFVSACALLAAAYLYRGRRRRLFLRIPALLILTLIAAGAVLRLPGPARTRPAAILIDASQSMARYLPGIVRRLDERGLPGDRYFIRDRALVAARPGPDSLGRRTDLGTALAAARRTDASAIVLLSDGRHNQGPDPRRLVGADWDRPVFTVAAGSDSLRDAAVTGVSYPAYVYPGDSFSVEVVAGSRGFSDQESTWLGLASGGRVLGRVRIPLGREPSRVLRRFSVAGNEPGLRAYRVSLDPRPAEADQANNEYLFRVETLPPEIRVLYYCGHPSFTRRFLAPALGRADRVKMNELVQTAPGTMRYDGRPLDPQARVRAADYDVVIVDQIYGRAFPVSGLEAAVKAGAGAVFLGGLEDLPPDLRSLPPILAGADLPAGEHRIQVSRAFSVLSPAEKYPPLASIGRVLGLQPDAVVIASSADQPVIAYRPFGRGTVFQINARDLTPWLFRPAGSHQEGLAADLLLDIVRFLSPLGPKDRLVLRAETRSVRSGSNIGFTLLSYDAALDPAGGGDFFLVAGPESIPFFEVQPGRYEATYYPLDTGDVRCHAAGLLAAAPLRSDELTIRVQPGTGETEMGIDWDLLRELAGMTGGRCIPLAELDRLELPPPTVRTRSLSLDLDTPPLYFLAFLLLAADWLLRRRSGIL